MTHVNRREVIGLLVTAPLAAAFRWTPESVREASALAREALSRSVPYEPKNFTPHEWDTVRLLVDLIIPKDERSGSATDAGVPEFMDFMLGDDPDLQTPVRGGLAWLDHECDDRYGKTLVACSAAERTAVLNDIACSGSPRSSTFVRWPLLSMTLPSSPATSATPRYVETRVRPQRPSTSSL